MHGLVFPTDNFTLGSVLRGCAGLRVLNIGRQVHGYVVKSGFEFNLVVGSSLAHMYMREQLGLYLFRCKFRSSELN